MEVNIRSIANLIEFVNREDVSKEDALNVAAKCFDMVTITFVNHKTGEATYNKTGINKKINESADNDKKHIWIM